MIGLKIGSGSYSNVYISQGHAVKVMQYKDFIWILREVCSAALCSSDRVIRHGDIVFGKTKAKIFMRVYGTDLHRYISKRRAGRIPPQIMLILIRDLAAAMAHIHSRGIIHGDIKPANILLYEDEARYIRAVLSDFGLSLLDCDVPHLTIIQTKYYRAPELSLAEEYQSYGPEIDVWSLGMVIYEMIVREPILLSGASAEDFNVSDLAAPHIGGPELCSRDRRAHIYEKIISMTSVAYAISLDKFGIIDIMNGCLDYNPTTRPTAHYVCRLCSQFVFGSYGVIENAPRRNRCPAPDPAKLAKKYMDLTGEEPQNLLEAAEYILSVLTRGWPGPRRYSCSLGRIRALSARVVRAFNYRIVIDELV